MRKKTRSKLLTILAVLIIMLLSVDTVWAVNPNMINLGETNLGGIVNPGAFEAVGPINPKLIDAILAGPPAAPTMLKAKVKITINNPFVLTWNDNSNTESKFVVQRKKEGYGFEVVAELPPNTTEFEDNSVLEVDGKYTHLEWDVKYTYRIQAVNSKGSSYSNESTVRKCSYENKPKQPKNFSGIAQDSTSIKLYWWIDAADIIDEIWIHQESSDGSVNLYEPNGAYILGPDTSELLITGLKPDTNYRYWISLQAFPRHTYPVKTEVRTGPYAPTNLAATTGPHGNAIKLTWDRKGSSTLDYTIERKTNNGNYTQIAYLRNPELCAYTDNKVSPGQKYTYRIQAWVVWTHSDYSAEVTAKTNYSNALSLPNPQQVVIKLNLGKTAYYVNQQLLQMDAAPIIRQGRTMLPIRYVTEALGADILWEDVSKKVTISMEDKVIELWIGKNTVLLNGQEVKIDPDNPAVQPLIMPPGRAMLPLRFISENLGCQVEWDPLTQEANIIYN